MLNAPLRDIRPNQLEHTLLRVPINFTFTQLRKFCQCQTFEIWNWEVKSVKAISNYFTFHSCFCCLKSRTKTVIKIRRFDSKIHRLQVNLCQKFFFLQNMGRTCCVQKLFWMSETISVYNLLLVSTKMHTTNIGQKKLSCGTRQVCRVPHDKFHDIFIQMKILLCGTRHVSWHIFPNENFVVCHTTYLMTHLEGKNTCVVCILVYYIAHECFLSDVFKIFQFLMTSSNVGR